MYEPWIGFDLDGTLAHYEKGGSMDSVGKPISEVVNILLIYHRAGFKCKIFTARAADKENIQIVKDWLVENNLPNLEITNIKDPGMQMLFDDRAVQVVRNKGKILGDVTLIDIRK